jgi:hypothetical protein
MLSEHYRSDPLIIGFANRHVYQQRLQLRRPPGRQPPGKTQMGIHFHHVAGRAKRLPRGSWQNAPEAQSVVERLAALQSSGVAADSIGVVTPFAGQKALLIDLLTKRGITAQVDTAFGYQGDERDVIIFSPVVSQGMESGSINWVQQPPNLLNVALTRARDVLLVVGDIDFLHQQRGLLGDLATYLKEVNAVRGSHPAELVLYSWMMLEGWTPKVHTIVGQYQVSFTLADASGVQVALVVRPLSYAEMPRSSVDQAREVSLLAAGYRYAEILAQDVIDTPSAVIERIRSLFDPDK